MHTVNSKCLILPTLVIWRARDVAYLACTKPWFELQHLIKLRVVVHTYSPSAWKVKVRKAEVQGYLRYIVGSKPLDTQDLSKYI